MRTCLIIALLFFWLASFAQIDPVKLDSLRRSIDASARTTRAWQDSFMLRQDTVKQAQHANGTDTAALGEHRVRRGEKKNTYTIIFIGLVFYIVLILVLRRLKRPST